MREEEDRALDELAAAILDGAPMDWPAAEAGASEEQLGLIQELRLLSTVADLHRHLVPPDGRPDETRNEGDLEYWGRLRLIERVGGGAFGDVYRAWDPRLDREVALKLIPVSDESSDRRTASILREARLLARVRHPGVVTIYDAERLGTLVGLSMEFIEGRTLEQRVEQNGLVTASETVDIGIQLADALAAVHDAGVLHRDVKASNVVIRNNGRVVLMDFGAGRPFDDASATDLTGTPLYLAPEVLLGQEATVRSDLYSLGVLLHHLLTGSYPVQARSVPELRLAHARRLEAGRAGRPRRPGTVPARLAAVLERATDPRPEARHSNAAALAADLRGLERGRWTPGPLTAVSAVVVLAATAGAGWFLAARSPSRLSAGTDRAAALAAPVRIAVLPFDTAGAGSDGDALRDGIANDLTARLQTFDNARVTSMASTAAIDALKLPPAEIGARLGVSILVAGHVVRSGEAVTVDVRLLALPEEHARWTHRYSGTFSELLDLQRAIALDVADRLQLQRVGATQEWPTRSLDAYTLYVRGRAALDKFTGDGTLLALQLFQQALGQDPDYAQAHAALAQLYLQMNPVIPNLSGEEAIRLASDAAARALSLDASLPEAHVAEAGVLSTRADWIGAEREFRLAIELGPSNVVARQQYAQWLALLGRFDEALDEAHAAESLDPLSPRSIMAVASVLRFARRFDEALVQARKALDLEPGRPATYLNIGHDYLGLGRYDEAIEAFERLGRQSGILGHAYALAGRSGEARAIVEQLERRYEKTGLGAAEIAQIYSGLGEVDRAFEWLDRRDGAEVGWPTTFKVAAVWDPLRSDPRFGVLLRKHGLED